MIHCSFACTDTAIELQNVISEPPPPFVPGPVTNIRITLAKHKGKSPFLSLSWCRPENCTTDDDVKQYHINVFTTVSIGGDALLDRPRSTNARDHMYKLKPFTVPGSLTKLSVTRKDGLIPLVQYTVEVKAESQESTIGEAVRESVFIRKLL